MYNMKSISGVRGWAGTALDALENQDIFHLFRNKRKGMNFTLKSMMLKAIAIYDIVNLTPTNFCYLLGGIPSQKKKILTYNSHENRNLYLIRYRCHFFTRLLANIAQNSRLLCVSGAGVIEL